MNTPGTSTSADIVIEVLAAFGLGPVSDLLLLGGTATRKWRVVTAQGQFVVRRRPDEFAKGGAASFDHAVLRRLHAAGFPVPCPLAGPGDVTVLVRDGAMYEVLHWIEGEPFRESTPEVMAELGHFLASFHRTLADDFPPGKEGCLREDHPDLLEPILVTIDELACEARERQQVAALGAQMSLVRRELDQRLYGSLPRAIIHGDFHPGNVRFLGSSVAALYDFDYLGVQARVRDVSDALMFFASRRRQPLDPNDIRSLTQPFFPDAVLCRQLLQAYQAVSRLTEGEWEALSWLIRSRWLQMRLRGSRKVPPAEKVSFILDGVFEVVDWLDGPGSDFFQQLRRESA
jgi:Ser/Thr protein kinase RdoA (MazF antagonist)